MCVFVYEKGERYRHVDAYQCITCNMLTYSSSQSFGLGTCCCQCKVIQNDWSNQWYITMNKSVIFISTLYKNIPSGTWGEIWTGEVYDKDVFQYLTKWIRVNLTLLVEQYHAQ
jgi:hypothetical protein